MLKAHKVVDALIGRGKLKLDAVKGCSVDYQRDLARRISDAAMFDFGTIPLVRVGSEDISDTIAPAWRGRAPALAPTFRLPELTKDEVSWWAEAIFPLPFPSVWYEFYMGDAVPMKVCTLINWREGNWFVEVVNVHKTSVSVTGSILRLPLDVASFDLDHENDWLDFQVGGNDLPLHAPKVANEAIVHSWAGKLRVTVWLTIALNSKSTDRRTETAPAKLNKQRVARGYTAVRPSGRRCHASTLSRPQLAWRYACITARS